MDIEYLKKFNRDMQIISLSEIGDYLDENSIWFEILSESNTLFQVNKTVSLWECFAPMLKGTIQCLKENLVDLALVRLHQRLAVLYKIKTIDDYMYYIGYIPKEDSGVASIKNIVFEQDDGLKEFYSKLHDGFIYHANDSSGLLPIDSWYIFNPNDWELIEDLSLGKDIPSNSSYFVFESGAGGYILIDIGEKSGKLEYWIWYDDREPRSNCDFWQIVDVWLCLLLEE